MFLFYFTPNSVEIVTYGTLVFTLLTVLITINYIDRFQQSKIISSRLTAQGFFSNIGTNYNTHFDLSAEEKIVSTIEEALLPFAETKFKTLVSDLIVLYADAWITRNPKILQKYSTKKVYTQLKNRIDYDLEHNVKPIIKDLSISNTFITNYYTDKNFEYIDTVVNIRTTMYSIDSNNNVIDGNDASIEKFQIKLTLMLSSNVREDFFTYAIPVTTCVKCGEILQLDANGYCDSCDMPIQNGSSHWVISKISIDIEDNTEHFF